jgi:hypothetical protein
MRRPPLSAPGTLLPIPVPVIYRYSYQARFSAWRIKAPTRGVSLDDAESREHDQQR